MANPDTQLEFSEVVDVLAPMFGLTICRRRVGRSRSLSIGVGSQLPHGRTDLSDTYYGEWELGTYCGAWRLVRDGQVICGSSDLVDSITDLDDRLQTVLLPIRLTGLEMLSPLDIRIIFDDGICIDILPASTDTQDDELVHIFGPDSLFLQFSLHSGWQSGRSDRPWKSHPRATFL